MNLVIGSLQTTQLPTSQLLSNGGGETFGCDGF